MVEDGYFRTMGNRARRRPDADLDRQPSPRLPVVVVSESLAREYWKEPAAALGRRIRNSPDNPWRTIVGVVGDERDEGLAKPATPIVYWPMLMSKFWNAARPTSSAA